MIKSNRTYDILKYIAQIFLPAIGALYFALAGIWGIPQPEKVIGSITALDTFLGVLLHLSTKQYENSETKYDGSVDITETDDKKLFRLNVNGDPNDLDKQKEIRLKINKVTNVTPS